MSRILLGSFPADAHDDVRIALMAAGYEVYVVEDVEGLVTAARETEFAVAVIADLLIGGSGAEACTALQLLPFPPPMLVLSDAPTPGADAFAPSDDIEQIVEQVATLATPPDSEAPYVSAPPAQPATNGKAKPIDLQALLLRVRGTDYFTILGIPPTATDGELRAAHAALVRSVRDSAKESPMRHQHLEEVEAALAEALDVLGNPSLRAAYTRNKL